MSAVYSGADDWQALHELPPGAVLVDDDGVAYQVEHHEHWNETWLCPRSDEYAFIVGHEDKPNEPRVGQYRPKGNLRLVYTP